MVSQQAALSLDSAQSYKGHAVHVLQALGTRQSPVCCRPWAHVRALCAAGPGHTSEPRVLQALGTHWGRVCCRPWAHVRAPCAAGPGRA